MKTKTAAPGLDVEALREKFPALREKVDGKEMVYLDSACTALKSRAVAERTADFYLHWGGCGGKRSTHLASQKVEGWVAETRKAAAAFIGADSPNEIVFTSGTTEAADIVARSFPYEDGRREVIVSDLEHNAVYLPFREAAGRGEAVIKFWRNRDGRLDPADLKSLLSPRTALVAATRASNVLGGLQPLEEAVRIAHARGAKFFVDAAQALSSRREDVSALDADFLAFSGHKLGGPFGCGVLYGKETLLNRLRPGKVGGGTVRSVRWPGGEGEPEVKYLDAPQKLEAGVPNLAGIVALAEALALLRSLPAAGVRAHVGSLVARAVAGISEIPEVRILGRPEDLATGSLVSFAPAHEAFSPTDFNLYINHELGGRFVALRAGEHCAHLLHQSLGIDSSIRVSFFAYNTAKEVDVFLDALKGYVGEACR